MPNITQTSTANRVTKVVGSAVAADLCAVVIYVVVGRHSHGESLSPGGFLSTAWPFIIGVAGGYVGVAMTRWPVISLRAGAVVVGKCLVLGLVLRYGMQRAGTPFPYIVVTVLVLTALMIGWRLAALVWLRRTAVRPAQTSLV